MPLLITRLTSKKQIQGKLKTAEEQQKTISKFLRGFEKNRNPNRNKGNGKLTRSQKKKKWEGERYVQRLLNATSLAKKFLKGAEKKLPYVDSVILSTLDIAIASAKKFIKENAIS